METSNLKLTKEQAKELLWRKSSLSWLLDANQQALYKLFHENPEKIQTWLLARRSGKTHSLCVLAIEYCLKHPRSIIKYVAPTKMQVERFIRPIITDILSNNCPEDLKPEYHKQQNIYFFSNGSELQLCGAEGGNIETIRGGFSHIAIIDEAQDVTDLKNAVNSVLLPTTLTTKGKILLSGTPPRDPDHEFNYFVERCENLGTLIKRTIYDNPRLTKEDIQEQITAMGGENTEDFRREYLCERIRSKKTTVIPEWDEEKEKECVKEWKRPPFYFPYTSMDLGFRDMTVVLFAYHDFINDKIIIENEIVRQGDNMHLATLARDIEEAENTLWEDPITCEKFKVKKRVADHDLVAINEIKKASNYRIHFQPADKKDMMGGINFLRTMINNNKIIVHPRCKVTISHLRNAKWANTQKDNLARGADESHYDAIPALSYLLRGVDFRSNPYPKNYNSNLRTEDAYYYKNSENQGGLSEKDKNVYQKMLGIKLKKDEQHSYMKYLTKGKK